MQSATVPDGTAQGRPAAMTAQGHLLLPKGLDIPRNALRVSFKQNAFNSKRLWSKICLKAAETSVKRTFQRNNIPL
jgi:hypothetical protein